MVKLETLFVKQSFQNFTQNLKKFTYVYKFW